MIQSLRANTNVGWGDPLDMLGEEAAEILQALFKLKRFGGDTAKTTGWEGPSNIEQLHQEVGDILAVIGHLIQKGVLNEKSLRIAITRKQRKEMDLFGDILEWPEREGLLR